MDQFTKEPPKHTLEDLMGSLDLNSTGWQLIFQPEHEGPDKYECTMLTNELLEVDLLLVKLATQKHYHGRGETPEEAVKACLENKTKDNFCGKGRFPEPPQGAH